MAKQTTKDTYAEVVFPIRINSLAVWSSNGATLELRRSPSWRAAHQGVAIAGPARREESRSIPAARRLSYGLGDLLLPFASSWGKMSEYVQ